MPTEIKVSYYPDLRDDTTHPQVRSSHDAFAYLIKQWDLDTLYYRECFTVLYLNTANQILGYTCISMGGLNSCHPDSRIIFGIALKCGARGIILSHNHPSKNPKPSKEDIAMTKKLTQGAKTLDLHILDHLIIYGTGQDDYYSFMDNNILPCP